MGVESGTQLGQGPRTQLRNIFSRPGAHSPIRTWVQRPKPSPADPDDPCNAMPIVTKTKSVTISVRTETAPKPELQCTEVCTPRPRERNTRPVTLVSCLPFSFLFLFFFIYFFCFKKPGFFCAILHFSPISRPITSGAQEEQLQRALQEAEVRNESLQGRLLRCRGGCCPGWRCSGTHESMSHACRLACLVPFSLTIICFELISQWDGFVEN